MLGKHKGEVMAHWQHLIEEDREEEVRENRRLQCKMVELATAANELAGQAVKGASGRGWTAVAISMLALLVAAFF